MDAQREQVAALVERVLARVRSGELPARPEVPGQPHGAYASVDDAVGAARVAHEALKGLSLEKRKEIVANVRRRTAEQAHSLSRLARDETGLGRTEDKVRKNLLVIHKTPGPEILESGSYTGDDGLTLVERAPYGVIASITPCTNPTETIINNGIGMISGGNAVVFNTHPLAKGVSATCIDVMNRASLEVGGPDDILTCVADPTIASANELMRHAGVSLVVVTGGGEVVKAAMSSGKKCVAAGPGNPPVVVDETADLDAAARGIVNGASLDNNIVCTDEKEVLAVSKVFDALLQGVVAAGAVQIRNQQIARLEKLVLTPDRAHVDKRWVGKSASELLKEIDVPFEGDPRLVVCEVPFDHPFVQHELLMPVVGFVRVPDVDTAIDRAVEVEHGFRHTASMYSRNVEALHRMARAADTSIFVKNAPNYAGLGLGGEGYTSFTIASPTGDGLTTARTFTRERRCTLAGYFRIV
jgi:acyl-CoA reductase-like NAD-dependent aldehyde dehydrogenase